MHFGGWIPQSTTSVVFMSFWRFDYVKKLQRWTFFSDTAPDKRSSKLSTLHGCTTASFLMWSKMPHFCLNTLPYKQTCLQTSEQHLKLTSEKKKIDPGLMSRRIRQSCSENNVTVFGMQLHQCETLAQLWMEHARPFCVCNQQAQWLCFWKLQLVFVCAACKNVIHALFCHLCTCLGKLDLIYWNWNKDGHNCNKVFNIYSSSAWFLNMGI